MIEGLDNHAVFSGDLENRRRRGRPKSTPAPVQPTSVRIPDPVFKALCNIAKHKRVPLHQLLNTALVSFVRDKDHKP